MAYTLNRRLAQLVDSNGQLNTGKIPNDYITGDHIADNVITSAMLHTSFTVSTSNLTAIDTDDVSEGTTNLYYTTARWDTKMAAADTDDLSEGLSNLYFTNERVDDRVNALLSAGTGITLTYDDAANTLTIAGAAQYGDSDVESYLDTNGLTLPDSVKAQFGASNDLQIYHDGNNSFIDEVGTGDLYIRATNKIELKTHNGAETYAQFNANGAAKLYYDSSSKLATTSTGIDVTGNIVVSGTVDGRDLATDGTKLDGIEANATADQTASEILTLIKTVDGAGSGLDADTLDGISSASFLRSDADDTLSGNLTVTGNLTVQGTTVTLDTATLNVEDKNITLNYSTGDSSGSADGAGITIQDAVNSTTDATILWDATNDEFDFSHLIDATAGIKSDIFKGRTYPNNSFIDFDDDQTLASNMTTLAGIGDINIIIDSNNSSSNGEFRVWKDFVDVDSATELFTITEGGDVDIPAGNLTLSGTVDGRDIASDGSKLDGIESGATADQTAAEILTAIKTVDGAGSGLDADLFDGLGSGSFLRSDTADTATGQITFNSTPILAGTSSLEGGEITFGAPTGGGSAFAIDNYTGHARIHTLQSGKNLQIIGTNGTTTIPTGLGTIWASGNDGSGSGLDADTVDGIQAASFLRSDTADTITGRLTASGGIDGLTLANGGISGSNYNITGVNQLTINDPGEGIVFGGGATTVTLAAIDDATDSIMNFSNASELRRNNNKVWDAGNDGSGSGLDADLLDGQQGSYYTNASNLSSGTIPAARIAHNSFDLGDLAAETGRSVHETGIYTFNRNNGTLGSGTDQAYYSVLGFGQGTGGMVQIAGKWTSPHDKLYWRSLRDISDNWWSWKEIWHSGNDGAGSGLDADTLDGQHGSYYQTANTALGYIAVKTGNYGDIKVSGGAGSGGGWAGYAIRDDWVFMSNGAATAGIYNDTNNEWSLICRQNAEVELWYNNVMKLETTANGIQVVEDTNYKGVHIRGNNAPNVTFAKGTAGDGSAEWKAGISGNDGAHFSISKGTANDDRLIITDEGAVGINVNPSVVATQYDLLSIQQDRTNTNFFTSRNNQGGFTHRIYADYNNAGTTIEYQAACGETFAGVRLQTWTDHPLTFGQNNTEIMRIADNSTGTNPRVGIGTASPNFNLHIMGSGGNEGTLGVESSGNSMFRIVANNGANAYFQAGTGSATSQVPMYFTGMNGSNNTMTVNTTNKRVGINDTTPDIFLGVYGDSSTMGTAHFVSPKGTNESHVHYGTNGNWYIRPANNSGNVIVKNYSAESDERLKENIVDITYGLSDLIQLQPRQFNWIDDEEEKEQNGFIAQEVEAIIPALVSTGEGENAYKAVDYNSIIAILVKSVQELKAENDALKTRLDNGGL